jgi:hypothetical protein
MKTLKFYVRWVLPAILAFAGLFEGISYGLSLTNMASDLAVFAGTALVLFTAVAFSSFIVAFFVKPAIKGIQ